LYCVDFGKVIEFGEFNLMGVKADGKATDKASVIRSKHSVTEQRRRSKINERYVKYILVK
jgi:hypothetical protein